MHKKQFFIFGVTGALAAVGTVLVAAFGARQMNVPGNFGYTTPLWLDFLFFLLVGVFSFCLIACVILGIRRVMRK